MAVTAATTSISLVTIRLELPSLPSPDTIPHQVIFSFINTSHHQNQKHCSGDTHTEDQLSCVEYGDQSDQNCACCSSGGLLGETDTHPKICDPVLIKTHRGCRQFKYIVIETLSSVSILMELNSNDESTKNKDKNDEAKSDRTSSAATSCKDPTKPGAKKLKKTSKSKNKKPCEYSSAEGGSLIGDGASQLGSKSDTTPAVSSVDPKSGREMECVYSSQNIKLMEDDLTDISFYSGNPNVEVIRGILHLYKQEVRIPVESAQSKSEMICILAVPATKTVRDLLQFIAPVSPNLEHLKIVRDPSPNTYMVLLKFRDMHSADEFYWAYNGMLFSSFEAEVCHCVYVAKIESMQETEGAGLPIVGQIELPNCIVCLEKMDESVEGILTIQCNHSFHGSCLYQWGDTSCPICRYSQAPQPVGDQTCAMCEARDDDNLWICIICGHVGCGRYAGGHARLHFEQTQHTYSMHLENQRVWDYTGDNYVHRLIQSKEDGKLVEVSNTEELLHKEKVDSIQLEYTYLLTSQLESQRMYFKEMMETTKKTDNARISKLEEKLKDTMDDVMKLKLDLSSSSDARQNQEKKLHQYNKQMTTLLKELQDEKQMNKCLVENQQEWKLKLGDMEKKYDNQLDSHKSEVDDLNEQLRDLMFYLEAQQKLTEVSADVRDELQQGQIVLGAAADPHSSSSLRKSQNRKSRKK